MAKTTVTVKATEIPAVVKALKTAQDRIDAAEADAAALAEALRECRSYVPLKYVGIRKRAIVALAAHEKRVAK